MSTRVKTRWHGEARDVRPMLATLEDAPLADERWAYEPKYDGIRALVEILPHGPARIWSRLGNDKTSEFPDIVAALTALARRLKAPVLLDGEIVALDEAGKPGGFQRLQRRGWTPARRGAMPTVALFAFDLLREGEEDLRSVPLVERRARLDRLLGRVTSPALRLSEFVAHDGRALLERAQKEGWEGLVAKRLDSPYRTARRSDEWRKVKLVRRQEFVVGGWTEPRRTRAHFGALLLGVFGDRGLQYVGHTGTGFSDAELGRVARLLAARETPTCPFTTTPRTNARPHWVRPELVAEVQYTEWTADDKLRHPVYLGLRDDVRPESVRREPTPTVR